MKKYWIPGVVVFLGVLGIYYLSVLFAPGSYPYAEKVEVEVSESDLISLITNFKEENPKFKVPDHIQLIDGRDGHWYFFYFFDSVKNRILLTWTRPSGQSRTTWAFVAVNNGLVLGNWKEINKDFSRKGNKAQIEWFESNILDKVIDKIP